MNDKMDDKMESLFSLELVVEKLYLPHVACRFPAIAFRLLDFPTIVIKHVEDDLGAAIRQKVSFESSNHLPQQFHELKDRHGNFLVKKGKSCLFKMSPDVLKHHLISTPLYVMAIDLFPNVPKLLGNSTVPLDSLIGHVLADIAKLGPTVPSVHGDKGLFKLCNLMGVEIGYVVLGFRLLCLGPSLIPHLPSGALARMSTTTSPKLITEDMQIEEEVIKVQKVVGVDKIFTKGTKGEEAVTEVRDSFSMTEPMKADAFLQTVEFEEKAVNVNTIEQYTLDSGRKPSQPNAHLSTNAASTQTEKRRKECQNENRKWIERSDMKVEDDGIIINNIICPPPLFYNSDGAPPVHIERRTSVSGSEYEDMSVENLSDIESHDGYGIDRQEDPHAAERMKTHSHQRKTVAPIILEEELTVPNRFPRARSGERVHGLPVVPRKDTIFPLLSALINELSCIQDPQLLSNVSKRLQMAENRSAKSDENLIERGKAGDGRMFDSPSVVAAVATALTKKLDVAQKNTREQKIDIKADKRQKIALKDKPTPKARAENARKNKSKLVYGLTNTQRLRLQKANPMWLKNLERESVSIKTRTDKKVTSEVDELDATNFSDTLTEVRRLAEKELDSTMGGDTLRQIASEVEEFESTLENDKKFFRNTYKKSSTSPKKTHIIKPDVSQRSPITAPQGNRISSSRKKRHSPLRSSLQRSSPGSSTRENPSRSQRKVHAKHPLHKAARRDDSSDSDDLRQSKKRPVPLERHMFGITSPSLDDQMLRTNDYEEGLSARSDLPSSRSRSIEVHLPSADPDVDDNATISGDDRDHQVASDSESQDGEEDDIPLPDDSLQGERKVMELNFPRYVSRETSLPESIEGNPNGSLNISGEISHDSPLESTRQSKIMTEDPNYENESRVLQSTDYDTRQFHSTDEPELQGLMSDDENRSGAAHNSGAYSPMISVRTSQKFPVINPQLSENSPVPSVRRSTTKLDAGALSCLPSMSLSKGQISPSSSRPGTPKGNAAVSYGRKELELESIHKSTRASSLSSLTPRSGHSSPKRQTPRSRRQMLDYKASIHTDSVSSYMPSDPENVLVSLSSNSGNYSDDFMPLASGESGDGNSSVEQLPKIIPSRKLGYTIS